MKIYYVSHPTTALISRDGHRGSMCRQASVQKMLFSHILAGIQDEQALRLCYYVFDIFINS